MTDKLTKLQTRLFRIAKCIHIAVEPSVATDIAATCREAAEALSLLPPAQGWQSIETAPKATDVLIAVAGFTGEARLYDDGGSNDGWWWANTYGEYHADKVENRHGQPTHWMPLPAPPLPVDRANNPKEKPNEV